VVQHGAEAVHVASLVRRVFGESLGGGVPAADTAFAHRPGRGLHCAEANELHQRPVVEGSSDEDGVGGEVAVQKAGLVRDLQAGGCLQDEIGCFGQRKDVPRREDLGEKLAPEQVEGDVANTLGSLADRTDAGDVRVVEGGRAGELVAQLGARFGVQEYQVDVDVKVGVFRAVQDAEVDRAQGPEHPEPVREGAPCQRKFAAGLRARLVQASTVGAERLSHCRTAARAVKPAAGACACGGDIGQRLGRIGSPRKSTGREGLVGENLS
jgi:hypothetical protein